MSPDEAVPPLPSRGLNPFNYSLAELSKALVALVGFLGFAAMFLIQQDFDPGLVEALQTLVPAGIAVAVVFGMANATEADYTKAFSGLIAAGIAVFNYFGTVDESTVQTLGLIAGYLATFIVVAKKGNTTAG